jgi:hypothetical protein
MQLELEGEERVPQVCHSEQGRGPVEESGIGRFRGVRAIRSPLPTEGILCAASPRHCMNRAPQVEEAPDCLH